MKARQELEGKVARGRLTIFLGSIILADVPLAIRIESSKIDMTDDSVSSVESTARPYRAIFASYSHKDFRGY